MTNSRRTPRLLEQLNKGPVVCAEGYVFELERRGYLQAGPFVPEVVLEHPDVVAQLHRDFAHAGSDVVLALTYYAHREKLRILDSENTVETLNRQALQIAKDVAEETGTLVAGNVCNTNIYVSGDKKVAKEVRDMFAEQVGWAAEAGVDFVIGETFSWFGEAMLALDVIKAAGLPSVITLAIHKEGTLRDDHMSPADACARLKDAGADVVGLNCIRGPETMLPLLKDIADRVEGPLAALPVPYRTTAKEPTFQSLTGHTCAGALSAERAFPIALDPFVCTRHDIADFATKAYELGYRYQGVCCGAGPHHIRAMAEALGKTPPASRYSPDMSKHYSLGSDTRLKGHNQQYAKEL